MFCVFWNAFVELVILSKSTKSIDVASSVQSYNIDVIYTIEWFSFVTLSVFCRNKTFDVCNIHATLSIKMDNETI